MADKKITTLYVRLDVVAFSRKYKINLSDFLNNAFCEEYLGLHSKVKQLESKSKEVEDLRCDIQRIKENMRKVASQLSNKERDFLNNVPQLLEDGKEMDAIRNRFNYLMKRSFSIAEFEQLVSNFENKEGGYL